MTRVGQRRTLISIQQEKTATSDGMGGKTVVWSEFAKVYARQIIRRADANTIADQIESVQYSRWDIRYLAGVTPKMRLVVGSRVMEINAVYDPSQKRERLEIVCTELQNPGV